MMNETNGRVAGVCAGLPLGIQDLMWGTDNERVKNKSDRRVLKTTARILCDMCPIQAECIAQTIISREQHGRVGGIDVKARRLLPTAPRRTAWTCPTPVPPVSGT